MESRRTGKKLRERRMGFSFIFLISNSNGADTDTASEPGLRGFGGITGYAAPCNGTAALSPRDHAIDCGRQLRNSAASSPSPQFASSDFRIKSGT
jgi:hypothetical protein